MTEAAMDLKLFITDVSGFPKPGIVFRDITPLLARPDMFASVVMNIADEWRGKVDAVAALDARGFIFGAPLALALGIPFVPVRKKGKLPGETVSISYLLEYGEAELEIKKEAFAQGARVLVVDDLLATGGTAVAACALVESAGASIAGCAFVIELVGLGGREKLAGRDVRSLVSYGGGCP